MISSENGLLRGTVLLNVRGRDVGSFVEQSQRAISSQVQLPAGYYIAWSGQYENQQRARNRSAARHPDCARDYLWTALSNLPFGSGSGSRAARGSLRAYRRYLSPLAVELQLLSRCLGGLHCAVRHCRADGCCHGDLPERRRGTKA